MYLDDELKLLFYAFGFMIICIILFLGYIIFLGMTPTNANWDCEPYKNEGYNTKIVPLVPIGYECWIEHNKKFIPLNKWLAIKGVGE